MTSNENDIPIQVAIEILKTKKRPVVVLSGQDDVGFLHLERIFAERVELAQSYEQSASESETLLYLTQKGMLLPEEDSIKRFVFYLFTRWCEKYAPKFTPSKENQPVLSEIELIELQNIRIWLYDESIRLMNAGVITPGLDSIV